MSEPIVPGGVPLPLQVQPSAAGAEPLYSRNFWLVFAASFALNSTLNLFALFPLFVMRLGASAATIGAVMGTGSLAALAVRPAAGPGIDRFGRRWMALRFLLLDACAIALYLPLGALGWPLFAVRALQGALDGTARVALFAMVFEILPEHRRGEGMAIFSLCGQIPAGIAPLAGEQLIKSYGFRAFFAVSVGLCLLAAAAAMLVPDDRPPPAAAHDSAPGVPGYRSLLREPGLMPLWIVTLLFALTTSSRVSFVAPYAYLAGIRRVGWYFTIYAAGAVVVRLFGSGVMDRIGLERMLAPALAVLAAGIGLLALTGHTAMLEIAALIGGVGHGYVYPLLSALVIGRTGLNAMGRCSSIYTSLYDLGAMAGPYILGAVAGLFGYAPMFVVAGACSLAAATYFTTVEPRVLRRRLA